MKTRYYLLQFLKFILDKVFTPLLRKIGYKFTYLIKIQEFDWIKLDKAK